MFQTQPRQRAGRAPARQTPEAPAPAPAPAVAVATVAAREPDGLDGVLQRSVLAREKTLEARGETQRIRAHGRRTVGLLGNNLKKVCDDHLFLGEPIKGAKVEASPEGIHAYTSTGALPARVVQVDQWGSKSKVHQIRWHWQGQAATTAKWSTMFPSWMPPTHVRTLIQLSYPDSCAQPLDQVAGLLGNPSQADINAALHSDETKKYITRRTPLVLQQIGSGSLPKSYYPQDPPGAPDHSSH